MATYTAIINRVLTRLRESTVASPTSTDYSALIGEFVNETKREVEDAWQWSALRTVKTVTTSNGTSQYSITDAGKRARLTYPSELTNRKLSVYDNTSKGWLRKATRTWIREQLNLSADTGQPTWFAFNGFDSNDDPKVDFYLTPDGVYSILFDLIVPQDDFSVGTETLSVPDYPVILGAYAKAIAERGEDSGRTHGEAEARYQQALSDAIAYDRGLTEDEDVWEVE